IREATPSPPRRDGVPPPKYRVSTGASDVSGKRISSSRFNAEMYSSAGTTRRTAIEKSQYVHRRAQNGTCTETGDGDNDDNKREGVGGTELRNYGTTETEETQMAAETAGMDADTSETQSEVHPLCWTPGLTDFLQLSFELSG